MKTSDQQNIILEVKDLEIAFPKNNKTVVKNIHFVLEKNKTLAIVGESGSGKSLCSLAIMGLLPKTAQITKGQILFQNNGNSIQLLNCKETTYRQIRGSKIAMIFQEPMTSLNPTLKCGCQVAEQLMTHTSLSSKDIKQKVLNLFEEVQLPNIEKIYESYPHEISGGQKQRVMIAMAMACEPDILIADEPTTALDVTVQKEILRLIKSLQIKKSMAVLFITHDLSVVQDIADDIVVMYRGELQEKGHSQKVLKHPQSSYTQGLIACKPPHSKRPYRLKTIEDCIKEKPSSQYISKEERAKQHQKIYAQKPLLSVKDLSIHYPINSHFFSRKKSYYTAVESASFDIYKGETLGLVGESGCGKTTLGKTLIRLNQHSPGEIIYQNTNILNLKGKQLLDYRKKVQIIFQDPYSSLNPRLTVGHILKEVLQVHRIGHNEKEREEKSIELLQQVGLKAEHYNHYPHEFSGGQRQRIGIARALALEPELIICDESVSALDVSVQAQILNLLNQLKEQFNLTYLFISHDLSVVRYMSDRVMVMNKGKIEEIQESDSLFESPNSSYTKKLIDSIPGQ